MSWSTETFAQWLQYSNGNIYLVRGQDGYGELNRKSRVVGFKTTDQVDEILGQYKNERVLLEPKMFGYPLAIYKINSKKGVSNYEQNFTVSDMQDNQYILNKRFPETIPCKFLFNGELQEEMLVSQSSDTLLLDSTKIKPGMNRAEFECSMPDNDTLMLRKDLFVEGSNVLLLSNFKIHSFVQDWGQPQMNETVEHGKITLDKETFRYGIGSHASSRITYRLPRTFDKLHAVIGLDDESACGDGAYFIVRGDGNDLYRSNRLYSTQKETISVDVGGVRELELILDQGGKDRDCDHGDWANAWLEAAK